MRILVWLMLAVPLVAHAQSIQYCIPAGANCKALDTATLPSGTKANIRVLPCPATIGWTSALDGKAIGIVENQCPIEAGGDNFLVAFTDGQHTFTATDGTTKLTSTFTVGAPQPPVPQPTPGTITWTAPTTNEDGSTLTDLAGFRVYTGTTQVTQLGLVTSWKPTASGTYYLTAFTAAGAESLPSQSVVFTLATPPPVDPCKSDPLTLTVKGWPGANSGSRSLAYATNKPITTLSLVWPLKVTVSDARLCSASVAK